VLFFVGAFYVWGLFENLSRRYKFEKKIWGQVLYVKRLYIYENISLNSSSNRKCFKGAEKLKISISCSIIFFPENRTLYGMMWKI
jgi:hypothetical protein